MGNLATRPTSGMSVGIVVALVALVFVGRRELLKGSGETRDALDLLQMVDGPDTQPAIVESYAVLMEGGEDALPPLLDRLRSPRAARADRLIDAVLRIDPSNEKAVEVVRAVLETHSDARARRTAALALAALNDQESRGRLHALVDSDPALAVRQAAVVALAELGEPTIRGDLEAVRDGSTVDDLRERARALAIDGANSPPTTSVGGKGRMPGLPLVLEGPVGLRIERDGASLHCSMAVDVPTPLSIVFELGADPGAANIVAEIERDGDGLIANCLDVPMDGAPLARHAPIRLVITGTEAAFAMPRVGRLVSPDLPVGVRVIRATGFTGPAEPTGSTGETGAGT